MTRRPRVWPAWLSMCAPAASASVYDFSTAEVELSPRYEAGGLGECLRHAPGRAGEPEPPFCGPAKEGADRARSDRRRFQVRDGLTAVELADDAL